MLIQVIFKMKSLIRAKLLLYNELLYSLPDRVTYADYSKLSQNTLNSTFIRAAQPMMEVENLGLVIE